MQEYVSDAVVCDVETNGDLDTRVTFFTKHFGKFAAKAKSARKITSKLAPHLQPGNLIRARFVEKGGLQVVDALKRKRLDVPPHTLAALQALFGEWQPEHELWELVTQKPFSWSAALRILGWDPDHAACGLCGSNETPFFKPAGQEFFCAACASQMKMSELLYIS